MIEPWITIEEAKVRANISNATIYRYLTDGLPSKHIGRNRMVKESDVLKLKNKNRQIMLAGKKVER